ncbi:MAG: type II toxin-antitoxin system Phd/YefM family antitoxin [Solirubrobacteraceae bacterium]
MGTVPRIGVAEAKRRFSELLDRVGTGERIVVSRRGKPVVALVPPDEDVARGPRPVTTGFAAIAGALGDFSELDDVVRDIYADRKNAKDRPAPMLD